MAESYDYYKCAVCEKTKPAGGEVTRKIAFNRYNPKSQDETKKEARLAAYYALVCPACDTEHSPNSGDMPVQEK